MREDQVQRYARHILLPDVGGIGQRRLFDGAVVVDDLGGDAEAAVAYLAAAGVGTIVVCDRGVVAAPGFLFESSDIGRPKLDAARDRIGRLNPDVTVREEGDGPSLPPCPDLAGAASAALSILRTLACR